VNREGHGNDDGVTDEASTEATHRGRRLFGRRLAQVAEGNESSAMARWHDRLARAPRRRPPAPADTAPVAPPVAPAAVAEVRVAPPTVTPPADELLPDTAACISVSPDEYAPPATSAEPPSASIGAAVPEGIPETVPAASEPSPAAAAAPVPAVPSPQAQPDLALPPTEPPPTGPRRRPLHPWRRRLEQHRLSTPAEESTPPAAAASATGGGPGSSPDEPAPQRFTTTLKGHAVSAIARWRERRRQGAGGGPADGLGTTPGADTPPSLFAELRHDALRLIPAVGLCVIGIALTYGVCVPVDGAPERLYWRRQIAFLACGLMTYAVIAKGVFPVSRRTTMRILYALCCIGLPLLVLLLGRATGNGTRWLAVAGMPAVQPAEFAKLILIWVVAELINPDQPLNRVARLRRHLLALGAVALPAFLVFLERSMGNTALLCLSVGAVLATRWLSWQTLMGLVLAGVLALAPLGRTLQQIRSPKPGINVAWLEARQGRSDPDGPPIGLSVREVKSSVAPAGAPGLLSHCPDRFACYLSQNGGWNARQALRCVRIGGVDGCGYREGSITILGYLPRTVQHTDFIYCVLSESFGFWGALVVLGLIGWLLIAILWTGVHSPHPAAWSFAVGFATLIFLQTLIHVGMALRVLPIIGIPLPFVSYGGSFLVTSFAALGLVARYDAPAGALASAPAAAAASASASGEGRLCQPELISV